MMFVRKRGIILTMRVIGAKGQIAIFVERMALRVTQVEIEVNCICFTWELGKYRCREFQFLSKSFCLGLTSRFSGSVFSISTVGSGGSVFTGY